MNAFTLLSEGETTRILARAFANLANFAVDQRQTRQARSLVFWI